MYFLDKSITPMENDNLIAHFSQTTDRPTGPDWSSKSESNQKKYCQSVPTCFVSTREIEAIAASKRCREKIAKLFIETESQIVDNVSVINSTFETLKELNKSDDKADVMRGLKSELHSLMEKFHPAATHATALYMTVRYGH